MLPAKTLAIRAESQVFFNLSNARDHRRDTGQSFPVWLLPLLGKAFRVTAKVFPSRFRGNMVLATQYRLAMTTKRAMTTLTPPAKPETATRKGERKRLLNVIYFIDSERTRSFKLSIGGFYTLVVVVA